MSIERNIAQGVGRKLEEDEKIILTKAVLAREWLNHPFTKDILFIIEERKNHWLRERFTFQSADYYSSFGRIIEDDYILNYAKLIIEQSVSIMQSVKEE